MFLSALRITSDIFLFIFISILILFQLFHFILFVRLFIYFYRLPGLESSKLNKHNEDIFYNEMMLSLLTLLTKPLLPNNGYKIPKNTKEIPKNKIEGCKSTNKIPKNTNEVPNLWMKINEPSTTMKYNTKELYKNLFNWKAYTHKQKEKIVIS